ncbi:hypothetical protein [Streptomyces enissocaesilis]|uniref:DUF5709 domain-containing protein n=1 Tax=Streptomyces enissocaesilis TaxID=332589 RepID=A0ABP6JZS9_9ACTN
MTVDPTDPDTFVEVEEESLDAPGVLDDDVSEADAAEQHTEWLENHDAPLTGVDPGSANEADAAEQARVVALDEDDYR